MSYKQMLSPPQGSLYHQCEQQDFCKGAEVLKSPDPVFSTPPSSSVFSEHINDDWNVQESPLAYGEFEAFSHVLLPENGSFGPDDLFLQGGSFGPDDLFQGLEELDKDPQPIIEQQNNQFLSYGEIEPENKPKLTLKLKKVKCPKRQKSTANNSAKIPTFKIVQSSLPTQTATLFSGNINENKFSVLNAGYVPFTNAGYVSPSNAGYVSPSNAGYVSPSNAGYVSPSNAGYVSSSNAGYVSPSNAGYVSPSNAGYVSPFSRSVPSASPLAQSPELTLKDALTLEDADVIIESSLSTFSNQSDFLPLSEDEINSPSEMGVIRGTSFWDNEDPSNCTLWSPTPSSEERIYPSSSSSPITENIYQSSSPSPITEHVYQSSSASPITEHIYQSNSALPITEHIYQSSPSPITEHIYQSNSASPIAYSTINYTDVATTPSPRQETSTKRTKKSRLSQESRKIRKKEQNKQAALRYRMKKKQEDQNLMDAVKQEEEEKDRLDKQYSSLRQEISFMKKLMRETLIARKLVSPNAFD